jgi:hypothetical protein
LYFRDKDKLEFFESGKAFQSFPQKLEKTGRLPLLLINRLLAYKAQAFAYPFPKDVRKSPERAYKSGSGKTIFGYSPRTSTWQPLNPN